MAKTAKLKTKPQSLKSRAARRATSPSLNLDKSLKTTSRPDEDSKSSNPLSARHNSGVMKKKAKAKPLTRGQRARLARGIEKAEAVVSKTEKKVEKSLGKGKVIKERSSNWEDLNEKLEGGKQLKKGGKVPIGDAMEEVEMEHEEGGMRAKEEPEAAEAVLDNGPKLIVVDRTATAEPEDAIT